MNHSTRICLTSAFLFISQYMLIPVLPVALAEVLGVSVLSTGRIFLAFVAGMILVGPLHSYLVDTYRTKQLCLLSCVVLLLVNMGYSYLNRPLELFVLPLAQGAAFGLSNLALTTIGIDLTDSEMRDKQNIIFGWFTRLGMFIGVALGSFLYLNSNLTTVLLLSASFLFAALLSVLFLCIPFRAPIGMTLYSMDRFFLPRTWVLFLNMCMITLVPALFFPLIYWDVHTYLVVEGWYIPFLLLVLVGFLTSAFVVKKFFAHRKNLYRQVVVGLSFMVISISIYIFFTLTGWWHLQLFSGLLLGAGVGVVTPALLSMFINLSKHCQRGTSNTTYVLAWQIGIALGTALACYLHYNQNHGLTFQIAMFTSVFALLFFMVFAYPHYKKRMQ